MESNFNNRDFEQFVKQNADQYRMFPSEKVWRGIHGSLHTRRRWFGIGLAFLLLTTGTVTWVMLTPSSKGQPTATTQKNIPKTNTAAIAKAAEKEPVIIAAANVSRNKSVSFIAGMDNEQTSLFTTDKTVVLNEVVENNNSAVKTEVAITDAIFTTNESVAVNRSAPAAEKEIVKAQPLILAIAEPIKTNTIFLPTVHNDEPVATEKKKATEEALTIESVVNSYKYTAPRKRLSLQVYLTPTISYRKLTENKPFLNAAQSASSSSLYPYATLSDINNVVTHKPDIGLELGFTVGYPLSKNIKIISGLQFNVSKYDIRAYSYPSEVATIALNSGAGANSVSTFTNYRNFNGYKVNWLHNLYLSVSAPVGVEVKVAGNKKSYVGMGSTFQPTYIIADRAYLISTDYKNYAEVPSLIRKWNASTSFEVFAGYSTGKLKWKVGPQVRYQLWSSFQNQYPVKEHLFDFGLKVGVMLNK